MQTRKLGRSDIQVPVITFGAWAVGGWMWGGSNEQESIDAIREALDLGMNCIDTAAVYGFGYSEQVVGKAIRGRRADVIIATKCGLRWDTDQGEAFFETTDLKGKPVEIRKVLKAKSIAEECEASLRRLGVETIDLYQCHFPDATTHAEESIGALIRLREQGKIRAIGVSNFSAAQIDAFAACAEVHSDQPHYSLLNRDIEAEILPRCREQDIAVLTHSTLERGLLAGKIGKDKAFPPGDHRVGQIWFQPRNRPRALEAVEAMRPIARAHGATLAQVAIAWILAQPGVTSAIVGARNPHQVAENAHAADVTLSREETLELREAFEAVGDPIREE